MHHHQDESGMKQKRGTGVRGVARRREMTEKMKLVEIEEKRIPVRIKRGQVGCLNVCLVLLLFLKRFIASSA